MVAFALCITRSFKIQLPDTDTTNSWHQIRPPGELVEKGRVDEYPTPRSGSRSSQRSAVCGGR